MTETELVLTVVARRNRPNSFLPESYSYKKLLKRTCKLLTERGKTSFCPQTLNVIQTAAYVGTELLGK